MTPPVKWMNAPAVAPAAGEGGGGAAAMAPAGSAIALIGRAQHTVAALRCGCDRVRHPADLMIAPFIHFGTSPLLAIVLAAAVAGAWSGPASAYTVQAGDLLMRPVAGAAVNVVRFPAATRATPQGGMVIGFDVDYSFDGPINFTGAFRPVFSTSFVSANLAGGVKYRAVQLGAPFIPYASFMVTTPVGGPLGAGDVHWNVGGRLAGGVDYFVMHNFAVGMEMAGEVSALLVPVVQPEATTEILAGVTWRF